MSDPREEINRIIAAAEDAAYKRGWRDAITALSEAAEQFRDFDADPRATGEDMAPSVVLARSRPRPGRPSTNAITVVAECITATPAMRGVDVVKAAQSVDPAIKE